MRAWGRRACSWAGLHRHADQVFGENFRHSRLVPPMDIVYFKVCTIQSGNQIINGYKFAKDSILISNLPLDFFFSWSNIMTTSITPPKREKKFRRSVSVRLDGKPPRNTLGQFPFLFCFCMLRGLHALGSIWKKKILEFSSYTMGKKLYPHIQLGWENWFTQCSLPVGGGSLWNRLSTVQTSPKEASFHQCISVVWVYRDAWQF